MRPIPAWMRIASMTFLFLLPLFILPVSGLSIQTAKAALLVAYALVSAVFLCRLLWKERKESLGVDIFALAGVLALVASVASAFAQGGFFLALQGNDFNLGSATTICLLIVCGLGLSRSIGSMRESAAYSLSLLSGIALSLGAQALKLLISSLMVPPAWMGLPAFSLDGKWNDVGVYGALLVVIALSAKRQLRLRGVSNILSYIACGLGLLMISVVNLNVALYALTIVALVGIFGLFRHKKSERISRGYVILLAVTFALCSLLAAEGKWGILHGLPSAFFERCCGISSVEVYPSVGSTYAIIQGSLAEHPLFGAGPDSFRRLWRMYKPSSINQSQFWATDFDYGFGFVPTFAATQGVLGCIAYLTLTICAVLLFLRLRSEAAEAENKARGFLTLLPGLLSAFLWLLFWFYTPGLALYAIGWASLALAAGTLALHAPAWRLRSTTLLSSVLIFILASLALASSWSMGRQVVAALSYERAVYALQITSNPTVEDLGQAFAGVTHALALYPQSQYARTASQIVFAKLQKDVAATTTPLSTEALQGELTASIQYAQAAISIDPGDSDNYIFIVELYRTLDSQGVKGASEQALSWYAQALQRNPHHPGLYVLRGRLHIQDKDLDAAKADLEQAIALKPNYTEAVFLLAEIEISQGDQGNAVAKLVARSKVAPVEPIVFFELGFIDYSEKDYKGAREALETAVAASGDYANAEYFLGLTYDKLGLRADALQLFRHLKQTNPDARELDSIIANLGSGKDAIVPTATSTAPEKAPELPVKEKSPAVKDR